MTKSPDFQKTLKRMLESPPKENKPLNHESKDESKPALKSLRFPIAKFNMLIDFL